MLESIQALLDTFPEAIVQLRGETVAACNAMARHYIPQLAPGAPVPDCLAPAGGAPSGAGLFSLGPASYTFSFTASGQEAMILFRPAPQAALTGQQLEGAVRQLRDLLGDILGEVGPHTGPEGSALPGAAFSRSFHRMFRLVRNLEYLQEAGAPGGVSFRPVTLDLDGLCRQTVSEAYGPLAQAGVKLEYESVSNGLLIPGDPQLLQRLLLGLIANSARAVGEGNVVLALRRQGERALLSLSDSGPLPDPKQLAALLQQGGDRGIPLPGQGAGLGLTIARHVVALHGGTLLVEWGQSAPSVVISLPTGPLDTRATVKTPLPPQRDGGLSPVLVELSDVLPARVFEPGELD